MRIVILQDQMRGGGTEKHTLLWANGFKALGEAVTVVSFRPGGSLAGQLEVPHVVLQGFDMRMNFLAPGLIKQLKQLKPELVLAMGYEANRRLPQIKTQLPGTKCVATLRGGRSLTRGYIKALQEADKVLTNSHWARQRAIEQGANESRCFVVNNCLGMDVPELSDAQRLELREALATGKDDTVLVCLAGFRRGKGQAELIGVLASLLRQPGLRLWLVGDGKQRKTCEELADVLDLSEQVVFPGRRKDVAAILQAADICVHASRTESQPNALIEAQACGLPVVALETAGVGETFLDGQSGLLIPFGDVQGLLKGATELVNDGAQRAAFAKKASAFALDKFNTGKNIETTLQHLRL